MSLHRRKWSQKEKEEILLYADEHGVLKTSREYNVSTATIYNWKNKFDELGSEGLESGAKTAMERELSQLKRENIELKKMVAVETMDRFRKFYNFERIHGGLEFTSPAKFLKKHGFDMKRKAA